MSVHELIQNKWTENNRKTGNDPSLIVISCHLWYELIHDGGMSATEDPHPTKKSGRKYRGIPVVLTNEEDFIKVVTEPL